MSPLFFQPIASWAFARSLNLEGFMTKQEPPNQHSDPLDQLEHLQASLSPLTEEFEQLHRLATMGTLAAGIAHEINNALTPVLAYAQLAQSNPDDHELVSKAISTAISGVESATRIAETILGFTSNKGDTRSKADIEGVVQSTLGCLAKAPEKHGIRVVKRIQPGLSAAIPPLSLQHALLNLLINACNAMEHSGGTITIAAELNLSGKVAIRVDDTGPGIDEDIAETIFEPFVTSKNPHGTVESSKTTQQGGYGLGLAISKHLIESSGGEISFTTSPGRGTTFMIVLPPPPASMAIAG